MKRCVARNNYITRLALDVEKSRFLHSEWYTASRTSIDQIEVQCKEPTELLFFQGGHYAFTYKKEDCFSQSQLAILYDLPPVHDVNLFKRVKVLCAPPGIKDFTIDTDVMSKQGLIDLGFKEVFVGLAPERTIALKSNMYI